MADLTPRIWIATVRDSVEVAGPGQEIKDKKKETMARASPLTLLLLFGKAAIRAPFRIALPIFFFFPVAPWWWWLPSLVAATNSCESNPTRTEGNKHLKVGTYFFFDRLREKGIFLTSSARWTTTE